MTTTELRAFHEGDERVFSKAVADHSGRLLAYMRAYVSELEMAEDLVQETWLKAYRQRATFRGDGSLLGWLLAVSRSVALDHLRAKKVEQRRLAQAQITDPPAGCAAPVAPVRLEARERAHKVRVALTELPPRQRDTLVLRILEDRSVRDTARALGCAEGTVKAALRQALHNLRTILQATQEGDS